MGPRVAVIATGVGCACGTARVVQIDQFLEARGRAAIARHACVRVDPASPYGCNKHVCKIAGAGDRGVRMLRRMRTRAMAHDILAPHEPRIAHINATLGERAREPRRELSVVWHLRTGDATVDLHASAVARLKAMIDGERDGVNNGGSDGGHRAPKAARRESTSVRHTVLTYDANQLRTTYPWLEALGLMHNVVAERTVPPSNATAAATAATGATVTGMGTTASHRSAANLDRGNGANETGGSYSATPESDQAAFLDALPAALPAVPPSSRHLGHPKGHPAHSTSNVEVRTDDPVLVALRTMVQADVLVSFGSSFALAAAALAPSGQQLHLFGPPKELGSFRGVWQAQAAASVPDAQNASSASLQRHPWYRAFFVRDNGVPFDFHGRVFDAYRDKADQMMAWLDARAMREGIREGGARRPVPPRIAAACYEPWLKPECQPVELQSHPPRPPTSPPTSLHSSR